MLAETFARVDARIADWERRPGDDAPAALEPVVEAAIGAARELIDAVLAASGKAPPSDADLLDAFKLLARGTPSWNAIRDNLRELVYYRNCIAQGRRDALPAHPARMALRTARHVYLYMKSRCETEGML